MLPEKLLPDSAIELATSTPMYDGTLPAGSELFPVDVAQAPPQAGGFDPSALAKPLKEGRIAPPERLFRSVDEWLHQVRLVEGVAAATVWLPSTNPPRAVRANTAACCAESDDGR